MSFKIRYELQEGYLRVCCTGSADSALEFFGYIKSSVMQAMENGVFYILFDESRASLKFDIHDAVLMSNKLDAEGMQLSGIKGAVVCHTYDLAAYKYFEKSLRGRGFNVRMFDDIDQGKGWLLHSDGVESENTPST